MKALTLTAACALMVAAPRPALAQQPVTLSSDIKVERTVTEDGKVRKVLEAPKVVVPGDRLQIQVTYRNLGTAVVSNFVLTNPLPASVELDAEGAVILDVSVDSGRNWGALAALAVPDGKGGFRSALPTDVTHVRWTISPLAPGAGGTLTFRAVVR